MKSINQLLKRISAGRKLSTLFILSFIVFGLLLILVSTLTTIHRETTMLREILVTKNKQTVEFLVEGLSNAVLRSDISFLQVVGERLTHGKQDILYYVITNDDGEVEAVDFSDIVTPVYTPDFLKPLPSEHVYFSPDFQNNVIEISSHFKVPYFKKWKLYVGFSLKKINDIKQEMIMQNAVLAVIYTFLSVLTALGLSGFILTPIRHFQFALNSVVKHQKIREVKINSSKEINDLAKSVNEISEKWKDDYESLQKVTDTIKRYNKALQHEKEQNEEELRIAHRLQMMLLPKDIPPLEHVDVFARCHPAQSVGGDFYQLRLMNDRNKLQVVIGDVTGHGVSAALMMAMANSVITEKSKLKQTPAEILLLSDSSLRELMPNFESFVTVFMGILDLRTFEFMYSVAGHNPAILLRKNETRCTCFSIESLYLNCPFPGEYENKTLKLASGDMIFFYTDGIPEARDLNQNFYSPERVEKFLVFNRDSNCETLIRKLLEEEIMSFSANGILQDDITAIALKLK